MILKRKVKQKSIPMKSKKIKFKRFPLICGEDFREDRFLKVRKREKKNQND